MILIDNDGPALVSTSYWQTEQARAGLCFLSTNAGTIRVLVPDAAARHLADMTTGVREVVLTRGMLAGVDAVELLFEDGSDSPFCLHMEARQADRLWPPHEDGKQVEVAIYTPPARVVATFPGWLRRHARLPYAAPMQRSRL